MGGEGAAPEACRAGRREMGGTVLVVEEEDILALELQIFIERTVGVWDVGVEDEGAGARGKELVEARVEVVAVEGGMRGEEML